MLMAPVRLLFSFFPPKSALAETKWKDALIDTDLMWDFVPKGSCLA